MKRGWKISAVRDTKSRDCLQQMSDDIWLISIYMGVNNSAIAVSEESEKHGRGGLYCLRE